MTTTQTEKIKILIDFDDMIADIRVTRISCFTNCCKRIVKELDAKN